MASAAAEGSLHRAIWAIALPSMLTNVATALFGLADLWVMGQLGDAPAQAGVELGAKFMLGLLVVFNFLRTGTVALTAQAAGRGDDEAQAAALVRALGVALLTGAGLIALMPLAIPAGLELLHARGDVADEARTYVAIRYWGGALWLANAVLVGWLIGRKRMRAVLAIEVAANILHIALDLAFVLGLGWGVAGVAFATLLSEGLKLAAAAIVAARESPASGGPKLAAGGIPAAARARRRSRFRSPGGPRPGADPRSAPCSGSTATCSCAPCCSPPRSCFWSAPAPTRARSSSPPTASSTSSSCSPR